MQFFSILASLDTARIIRESDFEKLDQCIPFLIRSSVGNLLNVRILDPAIARIYILAQLCLQHLLFCTKFLDKSVYSLRESVFSYQKKVQKLEELVQKCNEEIELLQKKLKRQEAINQPIFPCNKCTKNFLSAELLENHVSRKHQESKDKDSHLINTIKLELEIKQLKERLNATEKELKEATGKPMDCERCRENSQRKFENVGIQSNFEEKEKDDVEKDAVLELLNNQMRHFEEWKHNEETRYRCEITELREKLDETIEMLKQEANSRDAQPPAPAPRRLVIAEKCIGTSKSVEFLNLPIAPKPEETLWKTRYEELEKMYEDHQQRMTSTVTSIERMYSEKMAAIEDSVRYLESEKLKAREEQHKKSLQKSEEIPKPITPQIFKIYNQELSSSSESEVEEVDKMKPLKVEEKIVQVAPAQHEEVKPKHASSFSAQKFFVREKKSKSHEKLAKKAHEKPVKKAPEKVSKKSTVKLHDNTHEKLLDTRQTAEELFLNRLEQLNILPHQQRMSKHEFERVHSQMADIREETAKKNKSFYITRKKLKSQVDKIFQKKHKTEDSRDEKKEKHKSSLSVKSFRNTEAQPAESKEESPRKPPQIESNKPPKKAFRDDLEKILEMRLPTVPAHALKKNVQFNLDDKHESPRKQDDVIREVNEDESDFDITSFSTDAEEGRIKGDFK